MAHKTIPRHFRLPLIIIIDPCRSFFHTWLLSNYWARKTVLLIFLQSVPMGLIFHNRLINFSPRFSSFGHIEYALCASGRKYACISRVSTRTRRANQKIESDFCKKTCLISDRLNCWEIFDFSPATHTLDGLHEWI